uniref:Uncharacterized protein n=1 Tax=Alexandrium monilatum TaxID=311494 RepID=A0A7S4TB60_9DINO
MWTPHDAAVGDGPEMVAAWSAGADVLVVDYGSPVAGTPTPSTPLGGLMASFPGAPLAASTLPFADIAAHACSQAPALEAQVEAISSRVQKLERSHGQLSKDIADMLSETRDLQRKVGSAKARKQAGPTKALEAPAVVEEPADGPPGPGAARRPSRLKTAPTSSLPRVPEEQPLPGKSQTERIPPPPGLGSPLPESLAVLPREVDGREIARVEWRIENVRTKFRDCGRQRPLVSPQFEAGGISELRLMVFPNLPPGVSGLTMRDQKSRYEARIAEGPLSGALKFKVVTNFSDWLVVSFNLFVGGIVQGPIEHNFAEHIVHGLDFKDNWIGQIKNGSLVVGVEMLAVHGPGVKQGKSLES